MARTMSVDLSMTMTAAVPSAGLRAWQPSKSISSVSPICAGRHQRHRRAAGNDREQIVPAAAHAAGMVLDQLAQRNAHRLFDIARLVRRGRRCRTAWCRYCWAGRCAANQAAPRRMMSGTTAIDLDVVDRGRAAIEADIGRERRLQPRLALLAFEAFEQRRLLAADIGAGAVMDDRGRSPSRGRCSCRSAWPHRPRRSRPAAARARG